MRPDVRARLHAVAVRSAEALARETDLDNPRLFRSLQDQRTIDRLENRTVILTEALRRCHDRRAQLERAVAQDVRTIQELRVQKKALIEQHQQDKDRLFGFRYGKSESELDPL